MISRFRSRLNRLIKLQKQFSTLAKSETASGVQRREKLQFTKARLTDFGELEQGEIPDALQYDRPFDLSTLDNGVKVASEKYNSPLSSLTVLIRAGTRNETLESSGTCQFLERLNLRGTQNRDRDAIERDLANFGGQLDIKTSRETTTYTLSFEKNQLNQATEFLGDILFNSVYNKNQVEAEKEEVYRNAVTNHRDQSNVTMESVHYTAYRDHFMGQPVHGIRETINSITEENLKNFVATNYTGNNITLVGAGNISHQELVDASNNVFGKVPQNGEGEQANMEKPYFTPSMLYMRDDEMTNVNLGVFFEAPSYKDQDFAAMYLFKEMIGDFRADKGVGQHLNSADRQYSLMHTELGNMPDITLQKCMYMPYSDTGLFGSYFHGNEVFANQMLFLSQMIVSEYASYINPVEFFRARNQFFNKLLEFENTAKVSNSIANQVSYIGRRVPRSEIAKRVSSYDVGMLNRVATRWFWDKELAIVAWGPIHGLMQNSHYNRPIKRSTLGWYGSQNYKIV